MEQLRDHPVIRKAEKTGYAKEPKVANTCSNCGEPIYVGDNCFKLNWGWICEDCMVDSWEVAE